MQVQVWKPEGYATRTLASGRLDSAAVGGFWIVVDWLWRDELPSTFKCLRRILA